MKTGVQPTEQGNTRKADRKSEVMKRALRKTQLCTFFADGKCSRGARCGFAHGESELLISPDFTKTRLCPVVQAGKLCSKGDLCKFAHLQSQLLPSVHISKQTPSFPLKGRGGSSGASTASTTQESLADQASCYTDEPADVPEWYADGVPPASSVPYPRFFDPDRHKVQGLSLGPQMATLIQWLERSKDLVGTTWSQDSEGLVLKL
eukprot:TRINITY_DN39072_c0_g1_i1.p1 TRINITY_DN39072_c0_g1~~TRINITY_DN39072_c0_g1_i1.p1  ORF type:complete len:206 (-),score=21.13 TRINITY_DN39072_c0_g1_i1:37-654(-)